MDERADLFPVLSSRLWPRISQRFFPVAVQYMRKLGVAAKAPVACSTIDQFFQVVTSAHTDDNTEEAAVSWLGSPNLGEDTHYRPLFADRCGACETQLFSDARSGQVVCRNCGESASAFFGFETSSSEIPNTAFEGEQGLVAKRVTTYMYKRTNHFLDHLKRVQAKETTGVKPEVIEAVKSELAKERIPLCDPRITTTKVRAILKKLRLQKFYNHVFAITSRLSGKAAPSLTPLQEEKLLSMFQRIQEPFQKHCPPDRTNMISYSYVLRKLVEILGWNNMIDYFPLLKSRQKIHAQDNLWRKICDEVGYPFIRSVA